MDLSNITEVKLLKNPNIEEVNQYLNSGWVLLEIYKFNSIYEYSQGKAITHELPEFLLGKEKISVAKEYCLKNNIETDYKDFLDNLKK